jgi:sec-independent protein translocase protein TatA
MLTPGLRLLLTLLLLLGLPSCGMPGGTEWMWIGLIALLLFGGAKLPGLMKGLGSGIHEFKKGLKDGEADADDDDDRPRKELKGGDSKKGTE